ncbi:MAG: pilus assembly protein TadG-related protein, partial [Jatrophihabitantaceae bacterium]
MAVIVALLMTFGLLGLGAIAIDTGSWYAEKAQLQNGADGAALAVAQMCAAKTTDCTQLTALPVARDRANNNSNDNLSNIDFVCGTLLGPCPGSLCPAGSGNFVNVQTSTQTSASSSLPALMSRALPGNSGAGETVHACAQANWGFPTSANTVPMTISQCEWFDDTVNGTIFAAPPPYLAAPDNTPWPPAWRYPNYDPKAVPPQIPLPGGEDILALHGTANVTTNGDFETTPIGWSKTPNGPTGPTLSQNTNLTFVHDGAASLLVTWNTGAPGTQSADDPNQPTLAGQTYVLTAWVYVPTGQPAVRLYAKTGAAVAYSPSQAGDNAWHQLSIEFTASGTRVDIGLVS